MGDAEIWGPCGHNWLDLACYAAGALDDENEARAVEVQAVACATCLDELGDHLEVAGLIYEAVDAATASVCGHCCSEPGRRRVDVERPARRAAQRP
ncbi:MAG: hypothetical protein K0R87_853 [Pseudonocardia sp.]|jgi:hypothetical protein|nr:hypothetical protein [Pseudonocardia sp.]